MLVETGTIFESIFILCPIIAITLAQSQAIFNRDGHRCQFTFPHSCGRKLTIHHIDDKSDDPKNLITICQIAHWKHLHNGAPRDQQTNWMEKLSLTAINNTQEASKRGWKFPK